MNNDNDLNLHLHDQMSGCFAIVKAVIFCAKLLPKAKT